MDILLTFTCDSLHLKDQEVQDSELVAGLIDQVSKMDQEMNFLLQLSAVDGSQLQVTSYAISNITYIRQI